MATSVISNTITDPSGTAIASVTVNARLLPRGGTFRTSDNSEVTLLKSTTTDASGNWSLTLERNTTINPGGTYYEIEEKIPESAGGPRTSCIQVGASNQTLYAALISTPAIVGTTAYITQSTADARYQALGSFGNATTVNTATYAGVATSASRSDHQHSLDTTIVGQGLKLTGGVLAINAGSGLVTSTNTVTVGGLTHSNAATGYLFTQTNTSTAIVGVNQGQVQYNSNSSAVYLYNGAARITNTVQGATVATSQTTASTSYTDLATVGPSVTLFTGTRALVFIACQASNDTAPDSCQMSFAVSGATTVAASDANGLLMSAPGNTYKESMARWVSITGLTPGLNTFTAKYDVNGGTGTFLNRDIVVQALP